MTSHAQAIAAVLRHPAPVRQPLANELRGSVVQLLGPGTTVPTWTATPEVLGAAIAEHLARAEREEKDIPADSATIGTQGTTSTAPAHALVLEPDGIDLVGTCRCGRPIGRAPLTRSIDGLVGMWEQHCAKTAQDTAWADALTSLPASTPIGSS
ncbi:hypothetical protein JHN63_02090 [Streptomyces sp. MBT65]|uniref:hypothetical protein n=1 Tax=Streptomyces sp. MBT65 TaxID=1488395 RepID=UPI00190956DF|nr:hypothetical protein [Streptomyces sp. MBT65]MBK3572632.1 hypothetical protein [Streptomyces sp. MBT65]